MREAREGADPQLDARIASMEVAFRMQSEAMDSLAVSKEPSRIREVLAAVVSPEGCMISRRWSSAVCAGSRSTGLALLKWAAVG